MKRSNLKIIIAVCLVALVSRSIVVESQIFDKLLGINGAGISNRNNNDAEIISNNESKDAPSGQQQQQPPVVSRVRDMFKDIMTVNVP